MPKPRPTALPDALPTTRPVSDGLRDAFALCPVCQALVLVQQAQTVTERWQDGAVERETQVLRWHREQVARDPVLGWEHHQRCPESRSLRPLWINEGQGRERLAWLRTNTGDILEVAAVHKTVAEQEAA